MFEKYKQFYKTKCLKNIFFFSTVYICRTPFMLLKIYIGTFSLKTISPFTDKDIIYFVLLFYRNRQISENSLVITINIVMNILQKGLKLPI